MMLVDLILYCSIVGSRVRRTESSRFLPPFPFLRSSGVHRSAAILFLFAPPRSADGRIDDPLPPNRPSFPVRRWKPEVVTRFEPLVARTATTSDRRVSSLIKNRFINAEFSKPVHVCKYGSLLVASESNSKRDRERKRESVYV